MEILVTSAGHTPLGFSRGSLLDKSEQEFFVGDMGGVLLPHPNLSRLERRKARDIDARWTGLRLEHLEACARRARATADAPNGPPGVVLMSIGEQRAPAVFEAVRRGLTNHLVIDSRLEYALSTLLDAR